jgi:serine/threonine-protein kinase RsbW
MSDDSPAGLLSEEFTIADLRRIRTTVQRAGDQAGLAPDRVTELVAVVNELVVNAILYAGGIGTLTMIAHDDGLSVTVSDTGPGLPPTATGLHRPRPDVPGGRGLWLARQMFPDLRLDSSAAGLTVTLLAMCPVRD